MLTSLILTVKVSAFSLCGPPAALLPLSYTWVVCPAVASPSLLRVASTVADQTVATPSYLTLYTLPGSAALSSDEGAYPLRFCSVK